MELQEGRRLPDWKKKEKRLMTANLIRINHLFCINLEKCLENDNSHQQDVKVDFVRLA